MEKASTDSERDKIGNGALIVVVDDDEDALETYCEILVDSGYRTIRCTCVSEALTVIEEQSDVSAIVCDLVLTRESGIQLISQVRTIFEHRPWIEIIIASGFGTIEAAASAMKHRVCDFLVKPFTEEDLVIACTKAVSLSAKSRQKYDSARLLETSLHDFKNRTFTALTDLLRGTAQASEIFEPGQLAPSQGNYLRAIGNLLESERKRRISRDKFFKNQGIGHPEWLIMLIIAEAQLSGAEITVKSVAYSAGLPLSTGLRKITTLCESGFLKKKGDPLDARRQYVSLMPEAMDKLQQSIGASVDIDR